MTSCRALGWSMCQHHSGSGQPRVMTAVVTRKTTRRSWHPGRSKSCSPANQRRCQHPRAPRPSSSRLLNGRFFLILGSVGPPFDLGSSPHGSGVQKPHGIRHCYGCDFRNSIAGERPWDQKEIIEAQQFLHRSRARRAGRERDHPDSPSLRAPDDVLPGGGNARIVLMAGQGGRSRRGAPSHEPSSRASAERAPANAQS